MSAHTQIPRRRKTDVYEDDMCPMTPEQIKIMLLNQEQLMRDVQDLKKYLFAGRVVFGTIVFVALTLDWARDHIVFLKAWIISK